MATVPTTLSEPIRVANLPLPPELAEMLDKHWRECRCTARERAFLEEDIKLRYHYAGHIIEATADPPGLLIHAIDLENPDEVHELTKRLRAQGYRHVFTLFPTPWAETESQIGILNSDS
jgi:hypothetical protein